MRRSRISRSLALVLLGCLPGLSHACTVCNSPAGRQVRAGLFNGHFLSTLALVLLPFPVFALLALLLHLGMPDLPGSAPAGAPSAMDLRHSREELTA